MHEHSVKQIHRHNSSKPSQGSIQQKKKNGAVFSLEDNRHTASLQRKRLTGTEPKAQVNAASTAPVQRMIDKDFHTQINNDAQLQVALGNLVPPVRGMIAAQYEARGATPAMLNAAIAASNLNLYDGMSRGELLRELRPRVDHEVANTAATYHYDPHGDKHFPGGPPGTKFTAGAAVVNPILRQIIAAQIARIRRDAHGHNQTYYYTLAGIPQCAGRDLTIQVDYNYAHDSITYHGYPDDGVLNHSLSRNKNGAPIA